MSESNEVESGKLLGGIRAYDHKENAWIDEEWEAIHGYLTMDLRGDAVLILNNGEIEVDVVESVDFVEGWPLRKRIKFYLPNTKN